MDSTHEAYGDKDRMTGTRALAPDVEVCRRITASYGRSYYAATRLFPRDVRGAVWVLYAFVRLPDEIVDTEGPRGGEETLAALQHWKDLWRDAYESGESGEPVLRAAATVFKKYDIPPELAESFFDAMRQDTTVTRYETYQELEEYMYGSAAVVGRMIMRVIGYSTEDAFQYGDALGYAMQLTNFLRDIKEDYELRDRIYLPREEMERFGVTEATLKAGVVTPEFRALMEFEIQRARKLYAQADQGVAMLDPRGRKAVRLSRVLYSKILDKIEAADLDVFSRRCRTGTIEKLYYALRVIMGL